MSTKPMKTVYTAIFFSGKKCVSRRADLSDCFARTRGLLDKEFEHVQEYAASHEKTAICNGLTSLHEWI